MSDRSKSLLLAVDVGNTNVHFGLFQGPELVADFRMETRKHRTSEEYLAFLDPLIRRAGLAMNDIEHSIVSCVVPPAMKAMREVGMLLTGEKPVFVDHEFDTGIDVLYVDPREMGPDRLVNAAYACRQWGDSIVVDFGTATTFDVVTAKGQYAGGCITPGIRVSMDALFTRASRLPRVEVSRPERTIGRSTQEAMLSGVYFGYVSMVDGLVSRLTRESGFEKPTVVATGGLAPLIAEDSRSIQRVEKEISLHGLKHLYDRRFENETGKN